MKTVLIFPQNFLNFRWDTIVKEGMINQNSYSSKSYVSEVFNDSNVAFLEVRKDEAFCLSFFCALFIHGILKSKKCYVPLSGQTNDNTEFTYNNIYLFYQRTLV